MDITIKSGMTAEQRKLALELAERHIPTRVDRHTYETELGNIQVRMEKTVTVRMVK